MTDLPPALREAFAAQIDQRLGLSFAGTRRGALDVGIQRACELGGVSAEELLGRIGEPEGLELLTRALTVGETYFFREPRHFEWLAEHLRGRAHTRLWSAACSSGEEPYTMAIVALEVFGPRAADRVTIIATDLNEEALVQARRGEYRPWAFRGVAPERIAVWFDPIERGHRVREEPRALVRFARGNITQPVDAPRDVDVVFCRNVLLYFGEAAIAATTANLAAALRPDGWLVTAATDPPLEHPLLERQRVCGFRSYARRAQPVVLDDSGAPSPSSPRPLETPRRRAAAPSKPTAPYTAAASEPATLPPEPAVGPSPAQIARDLSDRGLVTEALEAATAAVAERPFEVEPYVVRALIHQQRGAHREASRDARRALLLEEASPYPRLLLATSAIASGRPGDARRAIARARRDLAALPAQGTIEHAGGMTAADLMSACVAVERAASMKGSR